jgi:hypothetical protein
MPEPSPKKPLPPCPNCGSANTKRGLRKKAEELVLNRMMFQVPYRCNDCDHRFFGFRTRPPSKYAIPE